VYLELTLTYSFLSGCMASVCFPSQGLMRYKDQVASLLIGEHILYQGIYVVVFKWIMRNSDYISSYIGGSNTLIKRLHLTG